MVRRLVAALLAVTALALVAAPSANAQTRLSLRGFAGYQGYAMDDINSNVVEPINDALRATSGSGAGRMDELSGHSSFGGGLGLDLGPRLRVALDYESLGGYTVVSALAGYIKVKVPADAFLLTGTYFFQPAGKTRFGVGAGVGYYTSKAEVEGNITIGTDNYAGTSPIDGSGIGFHVLGELDAPVSDKVSLIAGLGYRSAAVEAESDDIDVNGDLDWSGVLTRAGITFYLK